MKRLIMVILLSMGILVPGLAAAAGSNGYLALKPGYFMPNDDSDGLDGFDSVFTIGLAAGVKVNPNVAGEVGWDYYSTEDTETGYLNSTYGIYKGTVTTWSVPLTLKLIAPIDRQVSVFAGMGIGLYNAKYEVEFESANLYGSTSDSTSGAGFHIVFGADLKLDANLALGMELKWSEAELEFDDFDEDINVGGTTFSVVAKYLF